MPIIPTIRRLRQKNRIDNIVSKQTKKQAKPDTKKSPVNTSHIPNSQITSSLNSCYKGHVLPLQKILLVALQHNLVIFNTFLTF